MSQPATAREALIIEALGDVGRLLDRVESLQASMEAGQAALASASAAFDHRLRMFEPALSAVAHHVKAKAVEHIVRRTSEAARQSIEDQTRAMNEAARLAFAAQVDPALLRLTRSLRALMERVDRPWDCWLTHAATAVGSALITWFVVATYAIK